MSFRTNLRPSSRPSLQTLSGGRLCHPNKNLL